MDEKLITAGASESINQNESSSIASSYSSFQEKLFFYYFFLNINAKLNKFFFFNFNNTDLQGSEITLKTHSDKNREKIHKGRKSPLK